MQEASVAQAETDAQKAGLIRAKAEAALAEVCAVMDEAKAAGFTVGFNLGLDYQQRNQIASLTIAKHF